MTPDDTAHPARKTLPEWSGPVLRLPPARDWLLVTTDCSDGEGECALPQWQSVAGPAVAVSDADEFATLLHSRRLGVRVAVCGSESQAARIVAAASAAGLLRDEIVVHTHGTDEKRLFCPACGSTSPAAHLLCSGCGCDLVPHLHFARRRASYLSTPTRAVTDRLPAAAAD